MTPVHLSRADWGAPPVVYDNDGVTPRPALAKPSKWLTVHYTGNGVPLITADRAAVIAAQQGLERFAVGAGKSNEYNYCLYSAAGVGYVVDYAGTYQAAHSGGENAKAVGVLFWVGVDQAVPDPMVAAYRWLRDTILYPGGMCAPGSTSQLPHKDMPDAATPCPGPVLWRWDDLLEPYSTTTPAPPEGDAMILVRNGNDPTGDKDTAWNAYKCGPGGKWWMATNDALDLAVAELGQPIDVTDTWMRAHGPVIGPNPGNDVWGSWGTDTATVAALARIDTG